MVKHGARTDTMLATGPNRSRNFQDLTPQISRPDTQTRELRCSSRRTPTELAISPGAARRPSREEAVAGDRPVRVRPGAPPIRWPRASTRPRRPVDAKKPFQELLHSSPLAEVSLRQGGRGLVAQANRDGAGGSLRSASHVVERGPMASARWSSKLRSTRNPRRPGRIPVAREPEQQAPAHPAARDASASAERNRIPANGLRHEPVPSNVSGAPSVLAARPTDQ